MKDRSIEDRLARLESLANLEATPREWGITPARIKAVRKNVGVGLNTAKLMLVKAFGETIPEETGKYE